MPATQAMIVKECDALCCNSERCTACSTGAEQRCVTYYRTAEASRLLQASRNQQPTEGRPPTFLSTLSSCGCWAAGFLFRRRQLNAGVEGLKEWHGKPCTASGSWRAPLQCLHLPAQIPYVPPPLAWCVLRQGFGLSHVAASVQQCLARLMRHTDFQVSLPHAPLSLRGDPA